MNTNSVSNVRLNLSLGPYGYSGLAYDPNTNIIMPSLDYQIVNGRTYFLYNLNSNITETISYPGANANDYRYLRKPCLDPVNGIFYFSPGLSANVYYFVIATKTMNLLGSVPNTTSNGDTYFISSVYSPTNRRIYLIPHGYSNQNTWYYINCDDKTLVAYSNGNLNLAKYAFIGAAYSPTENRIYLIPFDNITSTWYYINCDTGAVASLTGPSFTVINRYMGGIFVPTENKIFLVPLGQSNQTTWHYIDCSTGTVVGYAAPSPSTTIINKYYGAIFDPVRNRLTFIGQASTATNNEQWAFIQFNSKPIDPVLCAYFAQNS